MGKEKVNYLIIGLVLYRIAYTFSPFVAFYSPHGLNMITVFGLYFLIPKALGGRNAFSTLIKFLPIYLVSILTILFSVVRGLQMSMSMQIYLLVQDILWVLIIRYIVKLNNEKISKFILFYVLGFLLITSITTYYGCMMYPGLSRNMTAGELSETERILFSTLNIGGFDFIYTIALTIPLIIYLYKYGHIKLITSFLLIFPLLMAVYKAEYTTALLTSLMSFSSYFFPNFKSKGQFIKFGVVIGVLFLVLSTYMSEILLWSSKIIGSEIMADRLEGSSDIASGVGADVNSDANIRITLWTKSINNFFSNPLFGVGDNGGGHSWLFDNMSMFGVWGLFACLIVLRYVYKLTINIYRNSEYYFMVLFVFFMQIILSGVNTMLFFDVFIFLIPIFHSAYPSRALQTKIHANQQAKVHRIYER